MGRPRNIEPSLTTEILWILMDSPRPLFIGEIVALLDGDYTSTYIMPRLLQLEQRGAVKKQEMEREGMGKKRAYAYYYNPPDDLFRPSNKVKK